MLIAQDDSSHPLSHRLVAFDVYGVAVGVVTDFGVLKYDEWQNRESYKEEIIAAIEEERASMLQLVGAA